MHFPYTDRFPEAATIAGQSVAAALTAVVWNRPLRTRWANAALVAAIWIAAIFPSLPVITAALRLPVDLKPTVALQAAAMLATLAALIHGPPRFAVFALVGQFVLFSLGEHLRESEFELGELHLMWFGVLLGVHALRTARPATVAAATGHPRSFVVHDLIIFAGATLLAALITNFVFGRVIYNGDEVAVSFQANVFAHFRAAATIPPCPQMFENYWVFRHAGRAFSQYTPGWPLFMAPFDRLGVVWLAGPVMSGILAVALARLCRRVAHGVVDPGTVGVAGILGPTLAMLGPSLLLNGASRFSHTMVCACFAWSVESLCVVTERPTSRPREVAYAFLLGMAIALGFATRPADGGMLAVGPFAYFLWAAHRRRVSMRAIAFGVLGLALFGGLTLIILRLQLGEWFKTGYALAPLIHPEAAFRLSWPRPNEWRFGVPLATGAFCWWPLAPALGVVGLIQVLGGRERRVPFMLAVSTLVMISFYFLVEFGRGFDDGLGPRYVLPVVVPMAVGGGVTMAQIIRRFVGGAHGAWRRIQSLAPAIVGTGAVVYGVALIAPLMYPIAYAQYMGWTAPLRGAAQANLKNAIVIIEPGRVPAHETNLAQNSPMDPNPSVLFLISRSPADDACAREHFPGRAWWRAGMSTTLTPY